MSATCFALFETAIGHCGLAWSDSGICGVQLPGADEAATRQHMSQHFVNATECMPTGAMQRVIGRISDLLDGQHDDLADIELDMTGVPPFHQRVYAVARTVAPGQTLTYGEIAKRLGDAGAARAVGQALGCNPFAPVVPCHRVLAAGGLPGGFSAPGGLPVKLKMLEAERAVFGGQPGLF
jgi:methylated-DNA-[protein]-cysteine S-methyltransferase